MVEGNAFDYLRDAAEREPEFDLVVLDPPAFAKNKDSLVAARRGYKEINLRAMQILKPGGILVTASCSYHMAEEAFEERCSTPPATPAVRRSSSRSAAPAATIRC